MTPITLTSYDVGTLLALKGFAAAMLGGMGNPLGAVVGGLLRRPARSLRRRLCLVAYKDAIAFMVILLVLFVDAAGPVRPQPRSSGCDAMHRALLTAAYRRRAGLTRAGRARCCRSCCRRPSICGSPRWSSSFALAVLGLNLLMGFAGQVSLGHAGFFGIGAYAVAIGPTHLGVPSGLR